MCFLSLSRGQAVKSGFLRFLGALTAAALLAGPAHARGVEPSDHLPWSSALPESGAAEAPYGFVDFCLRDRADCQGGTDRPERIVLTPSRFAELKAVNAMVNRLPQVTDEENYHQKEYWTYPGAKGGDCEDLALEKRRILIGYGWPVSSLLLATVAQSNGEGHAVLLAETDRGEFVLDNLTPAILAWDATPYKWRKRQSPFRPYAWSSVDGKPHRQIEAKLPPLGALPPFFGSTNEAVAAPSRGN